MKIKMDCRNYKHYTWDDQGIIKIQIHKNECKLQECKILPNDVVEDPHEIVDNSLPFST
jgi:hypothetical protein